MAKEPKPPNSFSERDNPLLALLGRRTEEERFTQDQTDQVVDSFAVSALRIQKTIGDVRDNLSHAIQWAAETVAGQVVTLQETMVRMHTVLQGVQDSLMHPQPLMTKEQTQEQERRENSIWNRVFDFFGDAFSNLKDFFKTKQESSWWDLIKEAAFWITTIGLAYFFRLYKVVDTVIDGIRGVYNLIKEGRLVTAIKDYFKGISSALRGWVSNLFKTLREGVLARVTNIFTRMWTFIRESRFFRLLSSLGSDIALGFRVLYGKISPVVDFIVKELGLLMKEIRGLSAIFKGTSVGTTVTSFFTRLGSIFNTIGSLMNSTFGGISSTISRIVSFVKPAFTAIGNLFKEGGAISRVFSIFSRIGGIISRVGGTVFNVLKSVGSFILRFIPFAARLVRWVPVIGWVITAIDGIIGAVKGFFASEGKGILERIGMVFQGVIAGIVSGLSLGFLEFDQIMGWFDTATTWLGDVFYKMYEFFTTTLPGFFTETIPNFFTQTIPNFFAWLGDTIWNGVKKAAEIAWDAVTYPFVMIGDFFSNLVTDLQIMFAKIDLWIAEAMNIFGADEDDPAVIAAKQRLARLQGKIDDIPYDQLSPREQDARRQKERLRNMGVRENNLTEIDRRVREDERRSLLEATRGGQTTMNVVTTTNAATTAVSTGKQPATESDPSLRRAAGNIPYYGAGI